MPSYPSSWTEVCNLALSRLKTQQITSVSDGSTNGDYCNQFLGQAIEDILGEHDWNGATKRTELNAADPTPTYGYDYSYPLPVDFIRPVAVDIAEDWTIEEDRLLTDADDDVYLEYIARPGDAQVVPHYLRRAIAARLAVLLSSPLRAGAEVEGQMRAEYQEALTKALEADGKRSSAKVYDTENDWYFQAR